MAHADLREFLGLLEKNGLLVRVKAEVDPVYEIGAIVRRVFDRRGPALLFEKVKGSAHAMLSGAMDTFKRYALGIGTAENPAAIMEKVRWATKNPRPAVVVARGVCQENVMEGDAVDLLGLPVPLWHRLDGGKYIGTLGVSFVKDPETGVRNVGIYRHQLHGADRMGLNGTQQMGVLYQKHQQRGRPMPIAVAIGVDPYVLAASCFRPPLGHDELDIAGALRGAPVEMVRCRSIDAEAPANAEIVIEGEVSPNPDDWEMEGNFGEFTGYYGGMKSPKPVIKVKAVTHRNQPIFQGTLEGKPPSESTTLRTIGHSAGAWFTLTHCGTPGFKDCYVTDMGGANLWVVIQMSRQYYQGNSRQLMRALWATGHYGKFAVVVDADIDIYDRGQVEWAMATRVQPHRDIIITSNRECGINLDPSIPPEVREYPDTATSKIGIDATLQYKGFEFVPLAVPSPADVRHVDERWPDYGIDLA
ncbi:MAG: UbiD family decarboxylase [Candidatus Tectomicrobia bacterium]|nr:UbiD family decarboxylase [Candidatus Tectomicrobia bacterium]